MQKNKEKGDRLSQLKAKRQDLKTNLYKQNLEKVLESEDVTQAGQQIAKLDNYIGEYQTEFKTSIADLAAGLSGDLQTYTNIASEYQNYKGMEKFWKFFGAQKKADRIRNTRMQNMDLSDSLDIVIDYAAQLVEEISEVQEVAEAEYQSMKLNTSIISEKIETHFKSKAILEEELNALETQYKSLEEQLKVATPEEQATLVQEKDTLHDTIVPLRNEYEQESNKYKIAQEAHKSSELARDNFETMVRDLGIQATQISEKIDNVTAIYAAAPEAVKVMMVTKGMESVDKAINYATSKSTEMITKASDAVSDATVSRQEIELVDRKQVAALMNQTAEKIKNYALRMEKVRTNASHSEAERYKTN